MSTSSNESFVRWQEITRAQFSAVNNLVLALATALLAFHSTLLLEKKLTTCCAFGSAVAALVFLAVSIAFALWCAINRLCDFRITARIAHQREDENQELETLREESRSLGRLTWGLFWTQIVFFGLGAGCGALAVVIQIWSR